MGEHSRIEWTDHTFNAWVGCAEVSPACDHCYARSWAKRTGHPELWLGERRVTSSANWRQPFKWNEEAKAAGRCARVFCNSLADVFERHPAIAQAQGDLWQVIESTPWLIWLLLTKRPHHITRLAPERWLKFGWPTNVMIGITTENQRMLEGRARALQAAALATLAPLPPIFFSVEPMLEEIDLEALCRAEDFSGFSLHWVICGGESGPGARPMNPDWARKLRDDCAAANVAFFFKQWGDWSPTPNGAKERGTAYVPGPDGTHFAMVQIGKAAAGRELDGRTHDDVPPWFSELPPHVKAAKGTVMEIGEGWPTL